jgi:hypothetical protein
MPIDDSPEVVELRKSHEKLSIEINKVRRQRDSATNQIMQLESQNEKLEKALNVVDMVEGASIDPPVWLTKVPTGKNRATVVAILSDTHFDEVVLASEMDGINAYNRTIATQRLELWTKNVIHLTQNYLSGVTYDGMVLMLGGDIFSGDIHEELAETNEDSMLGSLLYWSEQIAASITMFGKEFKKVHVISVPGNHGRMSRKPRMKLRAKTNFDWLLSKMVERHFAGSKNITFNVPDSADCMVSIYGYNHLLTHGDQAKGGGGIGGIWPTVMRLRARKLQRYSDTGTTFKTIWMGHWHQYISTPELVVNGSMKGYDEYAIMNSFQFQVPSQALAIVTPEHNITWQCPVFFTDKKKEKW